MASGSEKQRRMELRREVGNRNFGFASQRPREPGPPYLVAYACLSCNRSFKRQCEPDVWYRKCPNCENWAIDLGRKFKPPKANSKSQWAKVKFLVEHGFVFQPIRDGEAGQTVHYPETLEAARAFVTRYADQAIQVPPPPSEDAPAG